MKRSAPNRKREKQKGKPAVKEVQPPEPEQEEDDLVAGCISRAQWTDILIQEDTDEIVGEIMDELICQVMDGCYKSYIEKQLVPYTVSWAKSYLTKTVECQILCLDQGDGDEEICTTEDNDPLAAIPDCWAQGCVPIVYSASQSHSTLQQEVDTEFSLQTESSLRKQTHGVSLRNCALEQDEAEKKHRKNESDQLRNVSSTCPPPNTDRKKILQVNKPLKWVRKKLLPLAFSSTEKKNVEEVGKNRDSVACNQKIAPVYHNKDPQPITKIDPKSFPQHCVSPQYEIIDNDLIKPSPQKTGGLPRLEPKLNKQKSKRVETQLKPPKTISKEQPERFQKRNADDILLPKHGKEQHKVFGPLRLDTMILAKGVSLLDSQAAETMPLRMTYPSQSTNLKPMESDVALPIYSVNQVAAGPPPQVTPITQTENCDN